MVEKNKSLHNPVYLIESPNAYNEESCLASEAIHWAGLIAALEILNA